MFNKKIKQKTDFGITIIIIIGIIAVLNFFSYQIFYRWDLTQNKDFSISQVSKQTAGKLDDVVNIKVYFSSNLPSQYVSLPQEVKDILDEYSNYSDGKIRVEFIDPKDDEKIAQELYMQGIPQLQFNVLEKDKYQVVKGYLGILVQYGGKSESIPIVQDTSDFEYKITSAIKKVTSKEIAGVGFVSSNQTLSTNQEISDAYKKLQEVYDVSAVDLKTQKEVPSGIKTLIIAGPKERFTEDELRTIDAFLMKGGSVIFLADGVKVGQGLSAESNDIGLNTLLEKYGLKLNNDLIIDDSNGVAVFNNGFLPFPANYPFWPKVLKQNFDQENAAVSTLESLLLPWASSIEVDINKLKDDKIHYLALSSANSWKESGSYNLNPQRQFNPLGEKGQANLAVEITGKFVSAYGKGETANGHIIIVGDSDFIANNFVQGNPDNLRFFQNIVDSVTLDEDLINIRSKGVTDRPIAADLSDGAKAAIRYLNIFGLTAIVIIFGMARYYIRKRSRFVDEI